MLRVCRVYTRVPDAMRAVLSPGRRKTPRSPKSPKTKASKEGKQPPVSLQLPAGEEKDRQPLLSPRSLMTNKKDKRFTLRLLSPNAQQFLLTFLQVIDQERWSVHHALLL